MKYIHFQHTNNARLLVPIKGIFPRTAEGIVLCENLLSFLFTND